MPVFICLVKKYHLLPIQRSCTGVGIYGTNGVYEIHGIHGQGFRWMTMIDSQNDGMHRDLC